VTACDILIFVEDPGAALYVRPLPEALGTAGARVQVIAAAHARALLADGSVPFAEARGDAAAVLDKFRPSLVVVGTAENPDTFAFSLVVEARRRNTHTVGVVDAIANAAERFRGRSGDPLQHAPDWLVVPDQATADAFCELGFPSDRIRVCGHPHYDELLERRSVSSDARRARQRKRWFPVASADARVVVFVAEISQGLNSAQYQRSAEFTLRGGPDSEDRTEVVLDEFLAAIEGLLTRPYLVLRLHPKQRPDDLPRHRPAFDFVSQSEPGIEIVEAADAVVGMTSMLLIEAAIVGRPTLSIVPRPAERLWLGRAGVDAIPSAATREEIQQLLPRVVAGNMSTVYPVDEGSRRLATEALVELLARSRQSTPR
jgi:hypothetical protein